MLWHSCNGRDRSACSIESCAQTCLCMRLLSHLYALPVRICAPHVPQDGIHGTPVVKLLFKLVRVT